MPRSVQMSDGGAEQCGPDRGKTEYRRPGDRWAGKQVRERKQARKAAAGERETRPIEGPPFPPGVGYQHQRRDHRDDAQRQVQIEYPPPVGVLRNEAAERGA